MCIRDSVNLTPHIVRVIRPDGETVELRPSDHPLRVPTHALVVGEAGGIPVIRSTEPKRTARLALTAGARQALANGLGLLGIAAPTAM